MPRTLPSQSLHGVTLRKSQGSKGLTSNLSLTISSGEIISVTRDEESPWKTNSQGWYAYVQVVISACNCGRSGSTLNAPVAQSDDSLAVIWLYHPENTTLGTMTYPFPNGLFFSDHCNCQGALIRVAEVCRKPPVAMFWGQQQDGCE